MKKRILFIILSLITMFVVLITCISIKYYKRYKFYRAIEQNKTKQALTMISQMSEKEVNAYSIPLFIDPIINILTQGDGSNLPLVKACEYGNYEIIDALLKKGADPNKYIDQCWTPIEAVFARGHSNRFEIAKLLIENGADVNLCASQTPALFLEASNILWDTKTETLSNEIITLLIDNGAKTINSKDDYSILHYSAHGNSVLISENLINKYNLTIDAINEYGETPLMMSAENNAIDTAKLLLEHGADRSIKNNDGKTAYDLALEKGHTELAELLKPENRF